MLNFEKYKNELMVMAKDDSSLPALVNGKLMACVRTNCVHCQFINGKNCTVTMMKWLLSEYDETQVD